MTKQVRDWQKDMELIEQYEHAKTLVHGWIPQAHGQDVPKEPVEEALKYWLQETKKLCEVNQQKQREILNLQIREKKLREAIKEALDTWEAMDPFDDPLDTVEKMINLLRPFYPLNKEEIKE